MAHMTSWVRQYTLRDLLDSSFDLFKERFTTLLLAAMLPYLLVILYVVIMRLYVFPGNFLPETLNTDALFSDNIDSQVTEASFLFFLGLTVANLVAFLLASILQCRIAVWHVLGEPEYLWSAFRRLAKPFWSAIFLVLLLIVPFVLASMVALFIIAIFAQLLGTLAKLLGSLSSDRAGNIAAGVTAFLVVISLFPVFLNLVWTSFISLPVSLARDHIGPFSALGKSFSIAGSNLKAHFWGIFLTSQAYLVFLALTALTITLLKLATSFISPTLTLVLGTFTGTIGACLFLGLLACFQTLVYIDGRCRRDNFELRLMAEEIGLGQELEQAFSPTQAVMPQMGYPDYSAAPSSVGLPSYAMPPEMQASSNYQQAPASLPQAFPDYSAPPPPPEAADENSEDAHVE